MKKKICLNVTKTEVVLFKPGRTGKKVLLKLNFIGKRLCPVNSVKYLWIKTDENLNWKQQISDLAISINMANTILSKLKHITDRKTQKNLSCIIWTSLILSFSYLGKLYYPSLAWAQNSNSLKSLFILQKKTSLWLIYFLAAKVIHDAYFKESRILKLSDKFALEYCV